VLRPGEHCIGETRAAKLDVYRQARDQIVQRITQRFGEGEAE
jgi:hypothetical protein